MTQFQLDKPLFNVSQQSNLKALRAGTTSKNLRGTAILLTPLLHKFRRFVTFVVLGLGLAASPVWAANETTQAPVPRRNVLIIYSWHDLLPWQAGVRAGLQEKLQQAPEGSRPTVYEERMDSGRIANAASEATLYKYLQEKYATVALDVVIAESQSAANFLLHFPDLFPLAKHFAVNVSDPKNMQTEHVFVAKEDPAQALLTLPAVMPDLQHLFAIVDNSDYGNKVKPQLLAAAALLPKSTQFELIENFSFSELDAKVQRLPAHSAVLYFPTFRDRDGVNQTPRNVIQHLSEIANAPLFGHHDTFLGVGMVGGYLLSARKEGELMSRMAFGLPLPSSQKELDAALKGYQFDETQLKRWNISSNHLPNPHRLINHVPSMWSLYHWQIMGGLAAIVLQSLMIAALVYFLRQRSKMTKLLSAERDLLEQRVLDRTTELRDTVDFNETVLLHSPLPMGVYAENGECVLVNDAYAHLVGATRDALLAQNFNTIDSWKKSGLFDDSLAALAHHTLQHREGHIVSSFGKEVWFDSRIVPVNLKSKKHLLLQLFDLSERKRDEEALRKSEELLSLALDASSLSIWDFDIAAGIVHFDDQWAGIVGHGPDAKRTTPEQLAAITHSDDVQTVSIAAMKTIKGLTESFKKEFRVKSVLGDWKWIKCSGKVVERDANGRALRSIGTNLDITERKAAEEIVRQLAYYDNVTNLPNRRLLLDRLDQALAQSKRFQRAMAIMFLDLDHFKQINDTLGHDAGDDVLKVVSERLTACVRTGDTVSRQGGDEFVIVLSEIRDASDVPSVAEKILRSLEMPITIEGQALSISTSIGVSIYPNNGMDDARELMKKADLAMYAAKKAGRNRVRIFNNEDFPAE